MSRNSMRTGMGKRKIFCWLAMSGLILILFLTAACLVFRGEKYQIYSQFSFEGGDYRQTTVNVIVNWNARAEEVADEIMGEYVRVNADHCADEVILRMYRSRSALKRGVYFKKFVLAI